MHLKIYDAPALNRLPQHVRVSCSLQFLALKLSLLNWSLKFDAYSTNLSYTGIYA